MNLIFFNPYIDYNDIDDPFKIGINDFNPIVFHPQHLTEYRVFIKENTYTIDNSYLF